MSWLDTPKKTTCWLEGGNFQAPQKSLENSEKSDLRQFYYSNAILIAAALNFVFFCRQFYERESSQNVINRILGLRCGTTKDIELTTGSTSRRATKKPTTAFAVLSGLGNFFTGSHIRTDRRARFFHSTIHSFQHLLTPIPTFGIKFQYSNTLILSITPVVQLRPLVFVVCLTSRVVEETTWQHKWKVWNFRKQGPESRKKNKQIRRSLFTDPVCSWTMRFISIHGILHIRS